MRLMERVDMANVKRGGSNLADLRFLMERLELIGELIGLRLEGVPSDDMVSEFTEKTSLELMKHLSTNQRRGVYMWRTFVKKLWEKEREMAGGETDERERSNEGGSLNERGSLNDDQPRIQKEKRKKVQKTVESLWRSHAKKKSPANVDSIITSGDKG